MPQTVHAINTPAAFPGLRADNGLTQDVISRLVEDAAGAKAGTCLVPGTDAEAQAIVPTTAVEITGGTGLGVALFDASKQPATVAAAIAADNEYDPEQAVPLMQKGRVWVLCDAGATITANSQAFVRYASGVGGTRLGVFREDDPGSEAAALPNAVFRSAHQDVVLQADTYRVALVEINLPNV